MNYNNFIKKADSVPEGLQEKYAFLPKFMPTMRRTSSKDDILKFYRHFDLAQNNNGYLFTWKHYLSILQEQLCAFDLIVCQSKAIIHSMSLTVSPETSACTSVSEGNKNLIDESCTRRDTKTDSNLKAEISKEFAFSPDICNAKKLPLLEENRTQISELLLGNDSQKNPSTSEKIFDEDVIREQMSTRSNSKEKNTNASHLTATNIELDNDFTEEVALYPGISCDDVVEKPHLEGKPSNTDTCLFDNSVENLEIDTAAERGQLQKVSYEAVSENFSSKAHAYELPVESNFSTAHSSEAELNKLDIFLPEVTLDMDTVVELATTIDMDSFQTNGYNYAFEKSHSEKEPSNVGTCLFENYWDNLEIDTAVERGQLLKFSSDAVLENSFSKAHANELPVESNFSTEHSSVAEFNKLDISLPEVNLDMTTTVELATTIEIDPFQTNSYNYAFEKPHLEKKPLNTNKYLFENSTSYLKSASLVEKDLPRNVNCDTVLENSSSETHANELPIQSNFTEHTLDAESKKPDLIIPDNNLNMNTIKLATSVEMVHPPSNSHNDAVENSHLERKLSDTGACQLDVIENDSFQDVSCDTASETQAYGLSMKYHFVVEPAAESEFTRATQNSLDKIKNINTFGMIPSPDMSYNYAVEKFPLDEKRSNTDACSFVSSMNDLVSISEGKNINKDGINKNTVSEIFLLETQTSGFPMKYHFSTACESEADYTTTTISFPEVSFDMSTPSELVTESVADDALEKPSLEEKRVNADSHSTGHFANGLKISSVEDQDLSQDISYDTVCLKPGVKELSISNDFSRASVSKTKVTNSTNFVPDISHEVLAEFLSKGDEKHSNKLPLKDDRKIVTASSVTLDKELLSSPVISWNEISKRGSVPHISKTKSLKNVLMDLKKVSKQIHKTINKISSLSTCAKCGAALQHNCKSKTCLELSENAGDMAVDLQTMSKKNKDISKFEHNILLGDVKKDTNSGENIIP